MRATHNLETHSLEPAPTNSGWTQLTLEGKSVRDTITTRPEIGTVWPIASYQPIIDQYESHNSIQGTVSLTHQMAHSDLALVHPISMLSTPKTSLREWLISQLPPTEAAQEYRGTPHYCDLPTFLQVIRAINANQDRSGVDTLMGDLNDKRFVTLSPDNTKFHLISVYYGNGPRGLGLFFHLEEKELSELQDPNRKYYAPLIYLDFPNSLASEVTQAKAAPRATLDKQLTSKEIFETEIVDYLKKHASSIWFNQFQLLQIVSTRVSGDILRCVAATSSGSMPDDIGRIRRGKNLGDYSDELGYLMYFFSQQIARGAVPSSKFKDIAEGTINSNILVRTTSTDLYIIGRLHRELSGRDTSSPSSNIRIGFESEEHLKQFLNLIQKHELPLSSLARSIALASLERVNDLIDLNQGRGNSTIDIIATSKMIAEQTQDVPLPDPVQFTDSQIIALAQLHSEQKRVVNLILK